MAAGETNRFLRIRLGMEKISSPFRALARQLKKIFERKNRWNMDQETEKQEEQKAAETAETAENTEVKAETAKAEEAPKEKTPEERICELTLKLAESEKLRLLALAEMDNQRKRAAKERENLRVNAEQDTLMPFLQVFDHFTMAVSAAQSAQSPNLEMIVKGMEMIQTEFDKAFQELGVEKINAVGKKFDPLQHEAMAQEPSETVPAGVVIKQWCMGFKNGDRLLKPAMVIVSSGKPQPKPAEEPASAAEEEAKPEA